MSVELLHVSGSDLTIMRAAQADFDNDTLSEADKEVIALLATRPNSHLFEHPQLTFRVTAPVFVANQLKSFTAGLTHSVPAARYESFYPEYGSIIEWRDPSDEPLPKDRQQRVTARIERHEGEATMLYEHLVYFGVGAHQAVSVLPMSLNTTWIWTGSLGAWARLVREDYNFHKFQMNVAWYPTVIGVAINRKFPVSWPALTPNWTWNEDEDENDE